MKECPYGKNCFHIEKCCGDMELCVYDEVPEYIKNKGGK